MNIVIAAVGGQGALFASKVIGCCAMNAGYEVKASEVHGMSQRGGSVISHLKYGKHVASPIVEEGTADLLLSFELLEAARYVSFVQPGGSIIVNNQRINPLPVLMAQAVYPANIPGMLATLDVHVRCIDAAALAQEAGSLRGVNAVMLGCMAQQSEFTYEQWIAALTTVSPPKFIETNKAAFDKGLNAPALTTV
jgi:indolepyruvate ferredoxin oxidoreductase beta subunit